MRIVLAVCVLLGLSGFASPQCQVPRFQEGKDFSGKTSGSLFLALEPRDFTIEKLTCLVEHLRSRNPGWKTAMVLIFSSKEAANNFNPGPEITAPMALWQEWARHKHVSYFLDSDGKEYFYITPLGYREDPSLHTKVDLPTSASPRCQLEILNRCLMAVVGDITYPGNARKNATFGRVTLSALIERDGSTSHIEVKDADVRPAEFKEALLAAAVQNLRTWQFDASGQETPFQIDYSYVIDSGPLARGQSAGQVTVVPALPWNVEIRVKAPKTTEGQAAQPKPQ